MKEIVFIAYGTPKGQPRVRACMRGRHAGVYDPGTADSWKRAVMLAAKKALRDNKMIMLQGPLRVDLEFFLQRPKSHLLHGGLRPSAPSHHVSKPDADNLAKAVVDALTNAQVWQDDALICELHIIKRYSLSDLGGCRVSIKELPKP